MRFIIYGAGGVGGVIGAQLFRHEHDVVLIARGDHLQAIRNAGLRFETPAGGWTLPVPAVGHPGEIEFRPDDVVILTMKSQHTLGALEDLRAAAGDHLPVICCQNGVANEEMALRRFAQVYAMCIYLPAVLLEPGVVLSHAAATKGILDAGCYPSGTDDLICDVTAVLEASGFSARPTADVMRWKYAKLLRNLGNSIQALCPSDAASLPARRQLMRRLRAEALACYAAADISCASREEEETRRAGHMAAGEIAGQPRGGGSTWQSVMRGTGNVEADYLNGEIVRLGRLHGVAVPANSVLQRLTNDLARRRGAAQSMAVEDICAMIDESRPENE